MPQNLLTIIVSAALLALVGLSSGCVVNAEPAQSLGLASTAPPSTLGTIVLADISDEPTKKIERFQPLANHLASHLTEFGVDAGEVKIAPDIETMTQWMNTGEADLYFDSLYPALIVSDQSGAQPILRRWKEGVSEYRTIFFAKADSGLTSLADLEGKLLAFESSFSTSGYMLPLAHLVEAGFTVVEKETTNASVGEEEVGYIFSEEDENTVQWVLRNKVIAGAVDDLTYFNNIPTRTREKLIILAETDIIPRQVVIVRPNMDPDFLVAIKQLLLDLDETEAGPSILKKFKDTAQFDEFPEGEDKALDRMRTLYDLTQPKE